MNWENDLITLHHYESELEAEMAQELLKSNSIDSFIIKDDPTSMGVSRGATLKILEKDSSKARILLNIDL